MEYKPVTLDEAKQYGAALRKLLETIEGIRFLGIHGGLGTGAQAARDADFICYVDCGPDIGIDSEQMMTLNTKIDALLNTQDVFHQRKSWQVRDNIQMVAHSFSYGNHKLAIHVVNVNLLNHAVENWDNLRHYLETNIFDWKVKYQSIYRLWINEVLPLLDPYSIREKLHQRTKHFPEAISSKLEAQFRELIRISMKALDDSRAIQDPLYFKLRMLEGFNLIMLHLYCKKRTYFGTLNRLPKDLQCFDSDSGTGFSDIVFQLMCEPLDIQKSLNSFNKLLASIETIE